MKKLKVSFVITVFNNKEIIDKCLKAVFGQSFRNFNVYVVDDCSTDGTPDFIEKKYPKVKVIRKKKQSGPSISRNLGIKNSDSEYVAFMDSDVILKIDWLKKLVDFMDKNKEVGISGGKLLFFSNKNKINAAGGGLMKAGFGFDVGCGKDSKFYNKQRDVVYVCSAAMLVRRSMLKKTGLFDDTYFYGYEDTDLGWRANIAGYRVVYYPDAVAYHMLRETVTKMSRRVSFYSVKNRIRSMLKNYEVWNIVRYLPINLVLTFGNIIVAGGYRKAKFKGLVWNFIDLESILKERKKVQRTRKIKDRELLKIFHKNDFKRLIKPESS